MIGYPIKSGTSSNFYDYLFVYCGCRLIVPLAPQIQICPFRAKRCNRFWVQPKSLGCQDRPPSRVCNRIPSSPAIQPSVGVTATTLRHVFCTEVVWRFHRRPPLVVRKTIPSTPTTHPFSASLKETANNADSTFDRCICHRWPLFLVVKIVPFSPTTQPFC